MTNIRPAQVAGFFYPADPDKLSEEINRMLDISGTQDKVENIFGIISPHAGYTYSGKTAAYSYNQIKGKSYKRVVIISPSHAEYFPGVSIFDGEAYETPFGTLEVDKKFAEELVGDSKQIFIGSDGHRREHALEVQLPFLQTVLKDFKIVPIVMGDQNRVYIDELAKNLAKSVDEGTLVVASSDLSHHHTKAEANRLDSIVAERISNFDFENLQKDLDNRKCEACGGGPVIAMMKAAALKHKDQSSVLHRSDSGDVTGDTKEVVGYLSAVIYGD
ncbi:MAG: AmmeMemoRadiSam system protein B [Ignavibacteriaceae bacterium]|nr:AmmeMemoRadiSam system protein B [Ignavibacteriaceae bacterium]